MKKLFTLAFLFAISLTTSEAQILEWNSAKGCFQDSNGECLPNTLLSALPFLRINPDARTGAMGDGGIAISADPNAMHFNASKLAFASHDLGLSATYSPWLQGIGLRDVYLAYLSGYKRIDDLQTIGFDLRYFSLGQIDFTDNMGNATGTGRPRDFSLSFAYARKLTENFAAALTAKYIFSNLASGQNVNGNDVTPANAFAVDLSFKYHNDVNLGGYSGRLNYGAAITNIGTKVTYTRDLETRDFIPTNLGLGLALDLDIDDYNRVTFLADMNKLMVPTPINPQSDDYDRDGDGEPDYRQRNLIEGIFGSFADAPGGFREELRELYFSAGAEYWYDNQFSIRAGYYYEDALKGNRNFLTVGLGLKYNILNMNLSYLVPTTIQRTPLDNTLRFGITFNIGEEDKG